MAGAVDRLLLAGYGGAGLLLALYFVCESGPCHWSRRREGAYLAAVLGLLYALSLLWSAGKYDSDDFEGILRAQQLMRLVLLYRLLRRFALPRAHPRFFEASTGRLAARLSMPAPSAGDQRKASEIGSLVEQIAGLASWGLEEEGKGMAERALEPALLGMLMLEDLMWAFKDLARALNYPLLVLLIVLPLLGLCRIFFRCLQLRRLSARVHQLVEEVVAERSQAVLQLVLASASVGTMLEVLRWRTVRQLTERALEEELLCTASKAILVDALQMKGIRYDRAAQHAVRGLLLSCRGSELTALKHLLDSSGSYHNLYKLVYFDITNHACRQDILGHFAAEAAAARKQLGGPAGVKVLSDIDDTLQSSGGRFPAGCDRRYPRHAVYPGFLALLRALDTEWQARGAGKAGVPCCNLVFISARPHVYKDLSEDVSYRRFRSLVEEGRMHSLPTLLPGHLRDSFWSALCAACIGSGGWRAVGERKFEAYLKFRELYREYDYCFCGDNGQGDLLAGQLMLREPPFSPDEGPRLLCVLIHRVLPDGEALAEEPARERGPAWCKELEKQGLILHEGYVGAAAALHARDPRLISAEQLAEIAQEAAGELDALRWAGLESRHCWLQAEKLLQRDLDLVEPVLTATGQEPVPTLRRTLQLMGVPCSPRQQRPGQRCLSPPYLDPYFALQPSPRSCGCSCSWGSGADAAGKPAGTRGPETGGCAPGAAEPAAGGGGEQGPACQCGACRGRSAPRAAALSSPRSPAAPISSLRAVQPLKAEDTGKSCSPSCLSWCGGAPKGGLALPVGLA